MSNNAVVHARAMRPSFCRPYWSSSPLACGVPEPCVRHGCVGRRGCARSIVFTRLDRWVEPGPECAMPVRTHAGVQDQERAYGGHRELRRDAAASGADAGERRGRRRGAERRRRAHDQPHLQGVGSQGGRDSGLERGRVLQGDRLVLRRVWHRRLRGFPRKRPDHESPR